MRAACAAARPRAAVLRIPSLQLPIRRGGSLPHPHLVVAWGPKLYRALARPYRTSYGLHRACPGVFGFYGLQPRRVASDHFFMGGADSAPLTTPGRSPGLLFLLHQPTAPVELL